MGAKTKGILMLGLVLIAVASALYIAPTFAHMNGDTDQTRDRDQLKERDCTCDCDCLRDQNRTRTRLHIRECLSSQNGTCCEEWQYKYQYQHECQKRL